MSVNGTAKDRRTGKDLSDSTQWTVKGLGGVVHTGGKDNKPLNGVPAKDAFAAVRSLGRRGIFAVAVRS